MFLCDGGNTGVTIEDLFNATPKCRHTLDGCSPEFFFFHIFHSKNGFLSTDSGERDRDKGRIHGVVKSLLTIQFLPLTRRPSRLFRCHRVSRGRRSLVRLQDLLPLYSSVSSDGQCTRTLTGSDQEVWSISVVPLTPPLLFFLS